MTQRVNQHLTPWCVVFVHHTEPIKYTEFIAEGTEEMVLQAKIASREYALNILGPFPLLSQEIGVTIYEFRDWAYKRTSLSTRQQAYTRPIAHESRAFARLDSIGENGTWAVNCHGWMKLSDKEFKRLQKYNSLTRSKTIFQTPLPSPMFQRYDAR
ncbi:uncharacterized protein CIMG_12868 [Coccidioides immitis RS]|uniref:Uncharacterized protein n=1 Tax=Coccidioides immitis (strain RS) TaxID=246410 RepID=A0A0D8JSI5_COCIM|nr:uncharacterized protein CIMG_12868 [Coccidioides immitis RS]KJF60305.1 hypothetical protein CIMG_12868 [Coccidioides immitis RS]